MSQIDLSNPLPSFIVQGSSLKRFVEWKCLDLNLSEEISDDMYPSS